MGFEGKLNGNYYSISNVNISSGSNTNALFALGNNTEVKNLNLFNFVVTTTQGSYTATLFAYLLNSSVSNVHLSTTNSSSQNLVSGPSSTIYGGGLVGFSQYSNFFNLTVENTLVNFPKAQNVGGLIGFISYCVISNCHNLGLFLELFFVQIFSNFFKRLSFQSKC